MRRIILLPLIWLAACATAPEYQRPDMKLPDHFSEAGVEWRPARPAELKLPADWWAVYGDADLDRLEARVVVDNQNLKAAEAQYRAAGAALDLARAARLPTVGAAADASRGRAAGITANSFGLGASAGWEPDLWGRIGLNIEAAGANAQASADDLAAARLSTQVLLAQTWYQLRADQQQRQLLLRTRAADARFLALTRDRYAAGVASGLDIAQSETQLASAAAQLREIDIQLAQTAHALALLLGNPGMGFPAAAETPLPEVPPVPDLLPSDLLPSDLLQHRPDVAAAERRVAAANAEIGIARSAWYPTLDLGASAGFQSGALDRLFNASSRVWSLGPSLALTLFDGGARTAVLEQARAAQAQAVAVYRQTVLSAFQEVQDNLAAVRLLALEARDRDMALAAARRATGIAEAGYRAGTASALDVITAQTAEYTAERAVIDIRNRRIAAGLQLMKTAAGLPASSDGPQDRNGRT